MYTDKIMIWLVTVPAAGKNNLAVEKIPKSFNFLKNARKLFKVS